MRRGTPISSARPRCKRFAWAEEVRNRFDWQAMLKEIWKFHIGRPE
jgi:hypothetical protein